MHHANVQGPSLEQELAREISGAPRREHFGPRPVGPDDSTFEDLLHPQITNKTNIFE